ncbi:helix-turn-helix domain-containing protein [Endozoicomonas sp.]|uniref:helix-turn-helix domain-containing protein n=1 Tax=Endozoicomonas sp. TaxID=1892382 RepID=UPI00288871D2|nr:helix-turn-helix transcriptional regulator [Endozoicomonas sp.]
MKTPADVQIIHLGGKPAFAVVPYDQWLQMSNQADEIWFPHEVVGYQLQGLSLIAAWRKYRKLSQEQLANRMGISQSAVAQMENPGSKTKKQTLERVARVLEIAVRQLED